MECRICDHSNLELAIDLGPQPWCNNFLRLDDVGKEPTYPLRVVFCNECTAAQLDFTVPKEVMFGDHTYLSGITRSLDEHFRQVAAAVDAQFSWGKAVRTVLDIGSNDGTQLKHFKSRNYQVLGVEPSIRTAKIANSRGIETINEFFNLELAKRLPHKFHVINAAGVFFHLEDLHSVTDGIREALRRDGVFIVQFLYMKSIVENGAFDQIYHEHLLYYNLTTLDRLLRRHGLKLFDAYLSPIHGGSIIGFAGHQGVRPATDRLQKLLSAEEIQQSNTYSTYARFSDRIRQMKQENLDYLSTSKQNGRRIFGFGAPAKGNTLLNYFGIGVQYLDCLVEKNEMRRGLYSPGMHIPIKMESELDNMPDLYYVLAWNFRDEILQNNRSAIERGVEFHFPIRGSIAS